MINSLDFPDGIKWKLRYVTGGDFIGAGVPMTECRGLYESANNKIIDVKFDTSSATNMADMFRSCSSIKTFTEFDTSNVTNMSYMFYDCSQLITIPQLNTSNVTDMTSMFRNCSKLALVPQLDTSKVTSMQCIFYHCQNLATIPQLDMSNVTNITQMFYQCENLTSTPDCNCVKVVNFGTSAFNSWLSSCPNIRSIGVIDCDSVTNIGYALGNASRTYLTHLGGFRNLGKAKTVSNTNSSYFLNYAPNLTYESVINVLNGLYDRASAGLSVLTLKLHANHLAMLSDDDIAIATNKGWTIV